MNKITHINGFPICPHCNETLICSNCKHPAIVPPMSLKDTSRIFGLDINTLRKWVSLRKIPIILWSIKEDSKKPRILIPLLSFQRYLNDLEIQPRVKVRKNEQ